MSKLIDLNGLQEFKNKLYDKLNNLFFIDYKITTNPNNDSITLMDVASLEGIYQDYNGSSNIDFDSIKLNSNLVAHRYDICFHPNNSSELGHLNSTALTEERYWNLPDANGTIALTDDTNKLISITYSELKSLRDNGQLIPGMQYRITDYECTTTQEETRSAGHKFDIIVTADSVNTLNENARAINTSNADVSSISVVHNRNFPHEVCLYCGIYNIEGHDYYGWRETSDNTNVIKLTIRRNPKIGDYIIGKFFNDASVGDYPVNGEDFDLITGINSQDYFAESNLAAWELKYCIDNDTTRFIWADSDNGKGVIYWMKDEFNNECPYDFKNIQFKRYCVYDETSHNKYEDFNDAYIGFPSEISELYTDYNDFKWSYTFTWFDTKGDKTYKDGSILTRNPYGDEGYTDKSCIYDNKIDITTASITIDNEQYSTQCLNNIVFIENFSTLYNGIACNHIKSQCNNMTFLTGANGNIINYDNRGFIAGDRFYSNIIGTGCVNIIFGHDCYNNTVGNMCNEITFGLNCNSNIIGNGCSGNFGHDCISNTIGNGCSGKFGHDCIGNTIGNDCYFYVGNNWLHSTFGNNCSVTSHVDNCLNIIIENGNRDLSLICPVSDGDLKNVYICQGVSSSTKNATITIPNRNLNYQTKVARNSAGEIKIYCEADLI